MNTSNEIYAMASANVSDPLTEDSSADGSMFDENDLISTSNNELVVAQLASAGALFFLY